MTRYRLHVRGNDDQGRGWRSGFYQSGGTWETAKAKAHALVANLTAGGWHVSKRRVDGSQTWLTRRENGMLLRLLVEVEEQP